jgi:hypothetical protein
VSDRSFVRFGGLAGILLALTSWAAALTYYGTNATETLVGVETYHLLHALIAVWALFAIVAVHWVARTHGEAWSFFATLVGVIAAVATIMSSLYPVAYVRDVLARPIDVTRPLPEPTSATDPLNVMTFGLTGLWFLIANLLFWRGPLPRRLALLGLAVAAVLLFGFVVALSAQASLVTYAAVIAGAVGGPLYWLWLGIRLRRLA